MEYTKLQETKQKEKMKPTGCESCAVAEGLAISEVKWLKFHVQTLKIVRFSPKPAVADKGNRAALKDRGYGNQTALQKEGVSHGL